jgi:hypothetical protein
VRKHQIGRVVRELSWTWTDRDIAALLNELEVKSVRGHRFYPALLAHCRGLSRDKAA